MKEVQGNMFSVGWLKFSDVICITTNGTIRDNGANVMGRGVARLAKIKFPSVDFLLGSMIKRNGNIVQIIEALSLEYIYPECNCDKIFCTVAFPTKHNWWENSDLNLIRTSAKQLFILTKQQCWNNVLLPRPGCESGKRDWITEVKPILEEELPGDKFNIIHI
jgi:hypothetical protein